MWRRERHELRRTNGSVQELRALLASCGESEGVRGRLAELEALQHKSATVEASSEPLIPAELGAQALHTTHPILVSDPAWMCVHCVHAVERLHAGIAEQKQRVAQANAEALRKIRVATKNVFEALVPSLEIDITCDAPEALGESGARFAVRASYADERGGCLLYTSPSPRDS